MAGYSGTPLAKKLGIKAGATIALVGAPATLDGDLEPLPDGVAVRRRAGKADVVVAFFTRRADLERRIAALAGHVHPDGGLWIA